MVEVDRERGRIGLRLADDPEIAGKTVEELAAVGSRRATAAVPRRDAGPRRWRGDRDRVTGTATADRDRDR